MIEIKATKAEGPAVPSQADFALKESAKPIRSPINVVLFLTGLAVYLKSIFPGWGDLGTEAAAESTDPAADQPAQDLPGATILELPRRPETGGKASAEAPAEAPAAVRIDPQPPMQFELSESPAVDLVDLNEQNAPSSGGRLGPALLPDPNNDNQATSGSASAPASGGGGSGGSGGGGRSVAAPDGGQRDGRGDGGTGGGDSVDTPAGGDDDTGTGPEVPPDPDDDDETRPTPNRAPRVTAAVNLFDVTGCAAVMIGLSDLLRNAVDPDGDVLTVSALNVTSGTLVQTAGGWMFDSAGLGPVTISYKISDGEFFVDQVAHFTVVKNPAIVGTVGNDLLLGTDCGDDIDGRAGDDNIDGRGGSDSIDGGAGDDHIVAGTGNDVVHAGSGNDIVLGGDGDDWISGGFGDDRLYGNDGDDTLFGDEGQDLLAGGAGDDLLFGGMGNDRLFGDEDDDVLDGGEGDDELNGGSGQDALTGGLGADTLDGGQGADLLFAGMGADKVSGGEGDDTVSGDADGADDRYSGDAGRDTLDYSSASEAISADLASGVAVGADIGNDTVAGFEILIAGSGDDTVGGSEGEDEIHGGAGDDTLSDGGGADAIRGGEDDDTVMAADDGADDSYDGGEGSDALDYSAASSGIVVDMTTGTATGASIGSDMIAGFESVFGGSGDDHFIIGTDGMRLAGGDGEDVFEFETMFGEGSAGEVVHEILDFLVGDRVEMSRYKIFDRVMDTIEDQFEDIYGTDLDTHQLPIRIRHERTDETVKTYIEADFDNDNHSELVVVLDGQHALMIVENA